jgi:hypothetical protein
MSEAKQQEDERHKRNQGKPYVTRLASLVGFGGVLLGRDVAEIFKEGHVYDIKKILGEIIVTDLGEHAQCKYFEGNTINYYAVEGTHCLTKEEYNEQQRREGREEDE